MNEQTLCHIIDVDKLLLKRATRGISLGRWNAPGGNIDEGESPEECAVREVFEETGLTVSNLFAHGTLNFYLDGKDELSIRVHLFSTKEFEGDLKSSEEGEVKWFDADKVPLAEMWPDDEFWLSLMLAGRRFNADFYLGKGNKSIVRYSVALLD
jgi:8-oxo-dGTP diphosphatase